MGNPYAPPGENPRPAETPRPPASDAQPDGGAPGTGPSAPSEPAWPTGPTGPARPTAPRPGPGPQHGGPGRPTPPAPDSPIARATARRVMHFLVLLLAAMATSALPVPWQLGALVFLGAAMVVGTRALVLGWRAGVRGGIALTLVVGVGAAGLVALLMLSLLAVWPQQLERQDCLARAVTISATRQCEVDFRRAVDERTGVPDALGR